MKKIIAVSLAVIMVLATLCAVPFTVNAKSPDFYISNAESSGISGIIATGDCEPIVVDGETVAADAAKPGAIFLNGTLSAEVYVRRFDLYANGELVPKGASVTFNQLADSTSESQKYFPEEETHLHGTYNLYIKLEPGRYENVEVKAVDENNTSYTVVKFTNLTVTDRVNTPTDEGVEVSATPVWQLLPADLAAGAGANACKITDEGAYAHFEATNKGDPYTNYVTTKTKVGRYIVVKYQNNSIVPRMQFYIAAPGKSIASDANMIEFDISANKSGWNYVIVDLADNANYVHESMELSAFRFDPIEGRNMEVPYTFDGTETVDVAYIKGFTTKAGAIGYLEANEFHHVTKTATLVGSQVVDNTYTDNTSGITYDVTSVGDGTYTYSYETDYGVRVPCDTTPVALYDGSKLLGLHLNQAVSEYDKATGVATYTVSNPGQLPDPNFWVFDTETQCGRYLSYRYRTTVSSQSQFFLGSTGAAPSGAGDVFTVDYINDGEWHTKIIDLAAQGVTSVDTETYKLNYLRMDTFTDSPEGAMEIEFIAFHDTEDAAYQYTHVYKTYKVTFKANNKTIAEVLYEAGTTELNAADIPAVPEVEGYTGEWEAFQLKDKNITVKAIYTQIEVPTEPEEETTVAEVATTVADEATTVGEVATTVPEEDATTAREEEKATTTTVEKATTIAESATTTDSEVTTAAASKSGCGSLIGGFAILSVIALAGVTLKKKN